ncbi:MAG: hypothetical protein U0M06_02295 [Clostridia bacterium]|nr:hypothetical protein [Clostridia bacterium]
MKALSNKITKNRNERITMNTLHLCISAAILTADDLWSVNHKTTDAFIKGFAEIINGYGDEGGGGLEALRKELEDRGIEVKLGDDFFSTPAKKRFERGRGQWIRHKNNMFICSRCGSKSIKRNYCPECGADMKKEV